MVWAKDRLTASKRAELTHLTQPVDRGGVVFIYCHISVSGNTPLAYRWHRVSNQQRRPPYKPGSDVMRIKAFATCLSRPLRAATTCARIAHHTSATVADKALIKLN